MSRNTAFIVALALLVGLAVPAVAEDDPAGHLMVTPDQLEWTPVGSMPAGARATVLEGDPSTQEDFTMRIEFPPNYTIPLHTHSAVERVTVLTGTLYFGIGETFDREKAEALPPGTLAVMDPGVPMYGYTGDESVVIQLNSRGPWGIEYVNPEEDPRREAAAE